MSALHPTFTDKDRKIGLMEDGEWHWFSIRLEDGRIVRGVMVPDGTYWVEWAVSGAILFPGPSDIEIFLVRYHVDDAGKLIHGEVGEKYHDVTAPGTISTSRRVKKRFADSGGGKIVVKAGSELSTHAHLVGLDYRVEGGRYMRENLILKFMRLPDEDE